MERLPRAFHLFWTGQSLSAVGDAMTIVAMPLVVLAATGSVQQMGRLTSMALAGSVLATAGAGFVIDRGDLRRIMIACDLFRFALMSLVPLSWYLGHRPVGLLYLVAISAALAEGLFYVGHVSLVARLVGRASVGRANSRVQATAALAFVLGPFVAGLLSARFGPTTALGIDAATFALSATSLALIGSRAARTPPADDAIPPPSANDASWLVGLHFIRRQPELSRLALAMGTYLFLTASIVDILVYRLKHELGQGDSGVGAMFGIASAASVVAATLTPRLRARLSFRGIWGATLVLQGCLLVASAWTQSFALIALAAALFMAPMTIVKICQASTRQEVTPPHLLGRVTSSYLTLITLPMPLGALLATTLAAHLGSHAVQAAIGVTLVATGAVGVSLWGASTDANAPAAIKS